MLRLETAVQLVDNKHNVDVFLLSGVNQLCDYLNIICSSLYFILFQTIVDPLSQELSVPDYYE